VATHSQAGGPGHHVVRVLKEHGKLDMLKGLITDEGSCALTGGGLTLTAADFKNIPYLAFKGDYSATSAHAKPQLTQSRRLVVRPTISSWIRRVGGRAAMLVHSGVRHRYLQGPQQSTRTAQINQRAGAWPKSLVSY
jgi:hypothetical protein